MCSLSHLSKDVWFTFNSPGNLGILGRRCYLEFVATLICEKIPGDSRSFARPATIKVENKAPLFELQSASIYHSSYTSKMTNPLNLSIPTALILIDNQAAFSHAATASHWGNGRSNPLYEVNIQALISAFRTAREASSTPLEVIHIFHSSVTPGSPLHPSHPGQGIRPLDFAIPASDGSEPVFWKSVNSSFIGTGLETHLREKGFRQIIFAGLTTDHCVSTTVRMAANLGVVDRFLDEGPVKLRSDGTHVKEARVDKGRIVLVSDATATFGKGEFDAETVHKVSVASLDGEFADIIGAEEVVKALRKVNLKH